MWKIIAALVWIVLSGSVSSAEVVQNGSFEDPFREVGLANNQTFGDLSSGPGSSWDVWRDVPGWTTSQGAGIEIQSNRTLSNIDAYDGSHYVELDSLRNSSMFQDVILGVGHHVLSFFYSPRTNDPATNGISYSLAGLLGGDVGDETSTAQGTIGFWSQVSQVFTVQRSGTYRLSFGATGLSDSYGGLIDGVSIEAARTPAVPLPLPFFLLASGAVGIVGVRRLSLARK